MDENMVVKGDGIESGCRRSNRVRKTRQLQSPIAEPTTMRQQRRTKVKSQPNSDRHLKVTNNTTSSDSFRPYSVLVESVHVASTSSDERKTARETYLEESKSFASSLAKQCNDPDAERLYCPVFKLKGCGCIQRYIRLDERRESSKERIYGLLHSIKEAKRLSCQKCYDTNEKKKTESGRRRNIGLGNGQKKSKAFEEFVLTNRDRLRYEFRLCERATQRILVYSNNFLHKRLKTVPERGSRVRRRKGRAVLGLLPPIERIGTERCCSSNCVALAATHSRLVLDWRHRVTMGQVEARRVLAEMLTPSAGTKTNCYNFISMVTGCSNSTISKVSDQMKKSGGDREPPEHGLKRWHKMNQRTEKRTELEEEEEEEEEEDSFSELDPFGCQSGLRVCRRFPSSPSSSFLSTVPDRVDAAARSILRSASAAAALSFELPLTFTQQKETNKVSYVPKSRTIDDDDDIGTNSFIVDVSSSQLEFAQTGFSLPMQRRKEE